MRAVVTRCKNFVKHYIFFDGRSIKVKIVFSFRMYITTVSVNWFHIVYHTSPRSMFNEINITCFSFVYQFASYLDITGAPVFLLTLQ